MQTELDANFALLTTGTLRLNEELPAGEITLSFIKKMLPFPDRIVLLKIKGSDLKLCLENAVSKYPALDGRWPAVSGLKF